MGMRTLIKESFKIVNEVSPSSSMYERGEKAVILAKKLHDASFKGMTRSEKSELKRLHELVVDPKAKDFVRELSDRAFRSKNPWKVAATIRSLLVEFGIPKSFSLKERLGFKFFYRLSPFLAPFLVPSLKHFVRKEAEKVILPGERAPLKLHLEKRRKEGVQINLNRIGEAILGEEEAQSRLDTYLQDLKEPEINYISVKLSSLYSQVQVLDFEGTLVALENPLRLLYRSALEYQKFINLDMEEWRDVELTKKLFMRLLSEEEFLKLSAGIVLQSYLPTALADLEELIAFAKERAEKGGAPIKIRLVKGANLGMEHIEASMRNWPLATYADKADVDANFVALIERAFQPEHLPYLKIGIGSHNLFTIAYALLLRKEKGLQEMVSFEMLEGMNEPVRRIVKEAAGGILLYCPVAKKEDFHTAFSYLIRRLDENTGQDHFLRALFSELPHAMDEEANRFLDSLMRVSKIKTTSFRDQNRFDAPQGLNGPFQNEADTDFTLSQNRAWIENHLELFLKEGGRDIPALIGGKIVEEVRDRLTCFDPSFPGFPLYTVLLATVADGERAVNVVKKAQVEWVQLPFEERAKRIRRAVELIRAKRGEFIAAMVADGGKTVAEADGEVSEAVDFGEYYLRSYAEWRQHPGMELDPKGVVLIASPWNFPLSIPSGGIFAALIAGNGVIFKPSLETPLVGWRLAHTFWEAGIPKDLFAFVVGHDETLGTALVKHPDVNLVILTGATETAHHLVKLRPGLDLAAETGGKNSLIVTAMADRDLAVRDVIQSAFSHAGQKCSALSLLILEDEVFRDEAFKKQLLDAARSLKVGSPWNLGTKVPPLIRAPSEILKRALTTLESGEEWLLKPERDNENPNLFSPGIKWGVKEGSYNHQTELFGPLLSVMRAKNLDHACSIANGTPYGLTAGLHSLDEGEMKRWTKQIRAGNLYINRSITGAIVQRQPFGGCKASQYGQGSKAGGPNYMSLFFHAKETKTPTEEAELSPALQNLLNASSLAVDELKIFEASLKSYQFWWNEHFSKMSDLSSASSISPVVGEENLFGYAPHHLLVIRVSVDDSNYDPLKAIALCLLAGTPIELSVPPEKKELFSKIPVRELYIETDAEFCQRMGKGAYRRVRSFSPASEELLKLFAKNGSYLVSGPVPSSGRLAFLPVLREIAISKETHRYGHYDDGNNSSSGKA